MKILFEISYVGSAYHGFQVQKTLPTVQRTVQTALEKIYGCPLLVSGCSRTDAGVHARRFFLTAEGEICDAPPCEAIPFIAPRYLPDDIAVLSARNVSDDFHVRYDVLYKEYRYFIYNAPHMDPFLSKRAYHFPKPLDEHRMNRAAQYLCKRADFSSYMAKGSDVIDTVREIKYCTVERNGDMITVKIAADGFLYNMVRIISGTLLEVGTGAKNPEEIDEITSSKRRERAGRTLPPDGLYLWKVEYKNPDGAEQNEE